MSPKPRLKYNKRVPDVKVRISGAETIIGTKAIQNMISQTSEYALRAVVCLGTSVGKPLTSATIAARTKVPRDYLSKVLQALGRAGLVEARRGLSGGYALTKSLEELSVLDVINSVDPLRRIVRCPLDLAAHRQRLCSLHRRLDEGLALVESLFASTTIAALSLEDDGRDPFEDLIAPGLATSGRKK